ncbi:MAG: DUF6950 family protein [Caulobacteraceae bacterium]
MTDLPPLLRRVQAAESATARFSGQPFKWGENDCLRMTAHALRELGRTPPLREAGAYATLIGAKRALRRTGHPTLHAWIDSWGLQRIPQAFLMPADLLALPSGDDSMPALALQLSGNRLLGFVPEEGGCCVFTLAAGVIPIAVWSAL